MKIICIYTRVTGPGKDERYSRPAERFMQSYHEFAPATPHELLIVRNRPGQDNSFDGIADGYLDYFGGGWDCGTWLHVADEVECDLLFCLNSFTYFHEPDWLAPFVRAVGDFGPGVYAPTASYEWNPHLRTPCLAFHPHIARGYPHRCHTREQAGYFEAGADNFSLWAERLGYPVRLVTREAAYARPEWRKPPNIFRRGDQSNVLVWDRHTDLFASASPADKAGLSAMADTHHAPQVHRWYGKDRKVHSTG